MNQPFFLHQYAKDFEAFCENVRNWDLEYHQLENGHFKSELLLFGDDDTQFTHASLNRMMKQHGSSPQGLMTFGILANPTITKIQAVDLRESLILNRPPSQSITCQERPGPVSYTHLTLPTSSVMCCCVWWGVLYI